jgi:hypothetical protein
MNITRTPIISRAALPLRCGCKVKKKRAVKALYLGRSFYHSALCSFCRFCHSAKSRLSLLIVVTLEYLQHEDKRVQSDIRERWNEYTPTKHDNSKQIVQLLATSGFPFLKYFQSRGTHEVLEYVQLYNGKL